jgi:hypothetical protein
MSATIPSMDTAYPSDNASQVPESFETTYLNPKTIRFHHDGQNLTYTASDGLYYPRVTLRRSFPLSADRCARA